MQITVVRSESSCPLGEVLEHSEKVGPGGGGSIYGKFMYIHMYIHTRGIIMYHQICKSRHGRQVPSTLQLV